MTKNYTYIKIGIVALFVAMMMMFSTTATANTAVSDPVTKVSVFDQTDHSVTLSFYLPENSGTNENGIIKSSITIQEVPTGQVTYNDGYGMTFAKKNGLYHRIVYIGGLTNNTDYTFTVQNYNQDGTINQPSVPITTKTYK